MTDLTALSKYMIEWKEAQEKADALQLAIRDTVLKLEETITVGNIHAVYSEGRKTYNYEDVAEDATAEQIAKQTYPQPDKIDYRKIVLDEMKIPLEVLPFSQSKPSVTLKIK